MSKSRRPEPLHTVPEAARLLSISLRNLRTLLSQGELAVVHISPRRIGIHPDDLAAFIARRRSRAGQ